MFGTADLGILERPYPGGTTGDLLARMELDATFAGNSYQARIGDEIVRLRPDWVEIVLEPRHLPMGPEGETVTVGFRRIGYFYYEGGTHKTKTPAVFLPNEVAHYAPFPDPEATYMGMSLLRAVIPEIQADGMATKHKKKFFENAATPNLSVSLKEGLTPEQFTAFVDAMDAAHQGVENAYKTLYTANGADVKVVGADMRQLDFKTTQGAGETRIAAAMRVHPVLVGLSEGLSGSSLNAGNYSSAKRSFADGEMRPLWRNAASSLEVLVPPPAGARLWFDDRDVAYLREDQKDAAEIQNVKSISIRQLVDAGYKPDSVVSAVEAEDFTLLSHSGLFSVQLQAPGTTAAPTPQQEKP
jgi:phage portal protein BeeE